MQDRALVVAIVAGNQDALAGTYDRYAARLYTYCRLMLPDPHPPGEAADAVADTFIIATAKLQGLRDPSQLGSWLHAVARNECRRQLGPVGPEESLEPVGSVDTLPAGLRERVLDECADDTPTGRAHRVSVTHRAGAFDRTGFPRSIIPPGPRWWHGVRRHPRAAAGVAAIAVAAVVAGTTVLLITGGPHRAKASTVALGGGDFATSSPASSPAAGRSSPSLKPARASSTPGPSTSAADGPTAGQSTSPGASQSPAQSLSPTTSPAPSPSPSPSPSPTPGTLQVVPNALGLSAVKGKAASGTFRVSAVGGPVNFLVTSANAKVTVSPAYGSLGSAGSGITVTVTVHSLVSFSAHLTVAPGNLVVTVKFTIKT
jgi:Sigma-70 region 2